LDVFYAKALTLLKGVNNMHLLKVYMKGIL